MEERLAWKQIVEKYQNQWVGLIEVEYEEDNNTTIKMVILFLIKHWNDAKQKRSDQKIDDYYEKISQGKQEGRKRLRN